MDRVGHGESGAAFGVHVDLGEDDPAHVDHLVELACLLDGVGWPLVEVAAMLTSLPAAVAKNVQV